VRASQLRPLVLAHQTSSALIPSHHPGAHQEPLSYTLRLSLVLVGQWEQVDWPAPIQKPFIPQPASVRHLRLRC